MNYRDFNSDEPTLIPEALTEEQKQTLYGLAAFSDRMNSTELRRLIGAIQQVQAVEQAKADEEAQKAALEEHYRQQRAREINEALRVHETERQIKRARVAAALGIPVDSPELEGL
jgi:hypothetical protein